MRIRHSFALLLSLGLFLAGSASATPQSYVINDTIPTLGNAQVVSYTIYGQSESAYAVGFAAQLDGVKGVSFCGDLLHSIGLNQNYQASPIDLGTLSAGYTIAAKMAQRWSFDLGSLGGSLADAAAGTQLAIWATIYGNAFTVTSNLNVGTIAAYNTVLGTDYTNLGIGNTVFLDVSSSGGRTQNQDHFFTPGGPATPEPGAGLLFSAGLAIVAFQMRREVA